MLDDSPKRRATLNRALAAVCIAAASGAAAQERANSGSQIFQQRTPDGRTVLTDRPVAGAVTQRTWQTQAEDAVAARERREQARLEALAVSERLQRQIEIELQRDHEFALARLQLAKAEANLETERTRATAAAQSTPLPVFVRRPIPRPPRIPRPGPPRPRLPVQPGFATIGAISS